MKTINTGHYFEPVDEEEKITYELWKKIMIDAVTERASDIHLEPYRSDSAIRLRVDGTLREISRQSNDVLKALVRIIKKMGNLNPDIEALPQDGKIIFKTDKVDGKEKAFDFRISTFPTVFGEKIVLRILDPGRVEFALKEGLSYIGFSEDNLKLMESILSKPYGLVIFSGPAGSGKTTTAYSALAHLVRKTGGMCNIISLEEPVEYVLEGVNQTRVDSDGEFNYLSAMRSMMRQDPDIVFVAEVPDFPSAQMLLQAALTGHLILTQVNSSDAAQAIYSFFEMGVEPYLISMILEGVISQRLARMICPKCKKEIPARKELIERIRDDIDNPDDITHFYRGEGCEYCKGSGYRGRTGIYQVIPRNDKLIDFLTKKPNPTEIRDEMDRLGIPSLRKMAIRKAVEGIITLEEALRCTWI